MGLDFIDCLDLDFSRIEGDFVIVATRWNSDIVENLVKGARGVFLSKSIAEQRIRVIRVPGAFEIPLMCKKVIEQGDIAAVLALGVVIRGDTSHFEYVAGGCANGILEISLQTGIPIALGVLTVDNIDQAIKRSGDGLGNKGAEAAVTALEMSFLIKGIG